MKIDRRLDAGNIPQPGQVQPSPVQPGQVRRRDFLAASLALLPASLASPLNAFASPTPKPTTKPDPKPARFQQDRFCISFWVGPPADEHMDEHYARLAAANFTVAMGGYGANTPETDRRQLDLCQKYGLKALVSLPGYVNGAEHGRASLDAIRQADGFPDHPACWGYMLRDEPNTALFPTLRFMVDHLRKTRPGRLGFINLYPTYASTAQLGIGTYHEYVSRYVQEVDPDVLCMDYYPRMEHRAQDQSGKPLPQSREGYCENLAILRSHALKTEIPFWNFFNAIPFGPFRDPTEAQKRWQIYTSLAYGAKGVLYFCYWSPGGAIFSLSGATNQPRRHYEEARRLNAGLKNLGPTLMQLTSEKVYRVPPGVDPVPILKGSPIRSLSPGDYLIGTFLHRDGRKAVLLNNYSDCDTAWPTVLFAAPTENITEVDPATGKEAPVVDDSPQTPGLQLSLGAAEGRLFLIRA